MPITRAEADALQRLPLGELRKLADKQLATLLDGVSQAKKAESAFGAWLKDGANDAWTAASKLEDQAQGDPGQARKLLSDAYRKAREWAEIVEIPVNLDKFTSDLDDKRTVIDGDRWKPYDEQIDRVKAYLASGKASDFGTNATPASISRTIRVSLPAALNEELARNGSSYSLAWTSLQEAADDFLKALGKAAKGLKTGVDSLALLLFGLAAAGAVWEYSKHRRGR